MTITFRRFDLADFKDFFQAITTCILKGGNTVQQNAAEIDVLHTPFLDATLHDTSDGQN